MKKVRAGLTKKKHYDDKLSYELAEQLELLTQSGKRTLDPVVFKGVKNICKRSDKYVKEAYNLLMEYLEKKHSEVRRSAFQACDDIFRRSHCFRELVVCNLEKVVKLTTEENLPPPQQVARDLRQFALKCIHEWNLNFGERYKKLAIGYRYLQQVEKIDFSAYIVDASAQQHEKNSCVKTLHEARTKNILAQIKEKKTEIKATVTSLSNCINLLLPHPDDFFISMEEEGNYDKKESALLTTPVSDEYDSDEGSDGVYLREVGMVNIHQSLLLDFTPSSEVCIQETSENTAIIENVREYGKVIRNKYHPNVEAWLALLSKSTGHKEELKELVELKGEIDDVLFKYGRMVFVSSDDVSSDSDLEEVPDLPVTLTTTKSSSTRNSSEWSILSTEHAVKDTVSAQITPSNIKKEPSDEQHPQPSTSGASDGSDRKRKLLAVAPKLPFDVDLYHWEDDKLPVPTLIPSSTDGHRFWVGSEGNIDELPVPEGSAALRTRVIEFTGNFTPVTHSCHVRLPSGKLCPRRDRYKCPFHGEIVPRDELGNCINPKDAIRIQELREKEQQKNPDWQNPKLLAEIKKTTGIDLKMPEKGRRKKKREDTFGLTSLKEAENTVKKRLEKKIFKKSVMRKVASAMDKMDQRKFKDKFGDQFHYFYDT